MNRQVTIEITMIAAGTLVLLWLYRSYLERSLVMQGEHLAAVRAEAQRERAAASNGTGNLHDSPEVRAWAQTSEPTAPPKPETPDA